MQVLLETGHLRTVLEDEDDGAALEEPRSLSASGKGCMSMAYARLLAPGA